MSFFPSFKIEKGDLFAIGGFFVLVLIFFSRFLDGSVIIAFKDLSRYFYPLRYLMVEQVKTGHLPLWNPYIFCGFPLLATLQIGFFYLPTVIHYLLPFNLAFNYYTILHYFLAACFMYALLRHYELTRPASFFGGLVFAFSGYLLSVSNMNTSLTSVVWLPLILLVFDKFINSAFGIRHSAFIWLALLLAIMFLGGEPTILYVTLWFLVFYALVFSIQRWRHLVVLVLALALAMGIVAVQLLPLIELSFLSDRVVLTQFDVVSFRSFPPRELLTFIFPYFFGNPAQFGGYTETLLGKTYQDWLISPYLGIFPLIFIFFSFKRKRSAFFSLAALAALFFAFGKYTPLYRLAYLLIPGISLIRFPVKFLFLTTFCFAVLSATGFDEIIRFFDISREKFKKALAFLVPIFFVALILSLVGHFFTQQIIAFLSQRYSANIPKVFFDLLAEIIRFNLQSFYNLTGYLFAMAVLFWLAWRDRIRMSLFIGIVILVTAADLMANGSSIVVGASEEVFSVIPDNYAVLVKDKGLHRIFYTPKVEEDNLTVYGDNYSAALLNAKDNFAANWHIPYHFFDFLGYESIKPERIAWFRAKMIAGDKYLKNFNELSMLNVKYVISTDKLTVPGLKLLRRSYKYGRSIYIYQNSEVWPRAYILNGRGSVNILDYRPGRIMLAATAETPGILFLSEAYYPGWKFIIDGEVKKVRNERAVFSAVDITPGRHAVIYVYDPLSLKLGAIVSAFSLLLAALCFLKWRKA